jgi:chemotaxis protein methyltransferase CheR
MAGYTLTDPLLSIWSALIEERTGIHYGPSDRGLLEGKLEARASESGFDSLLDYYYFVRYEPVSNAAVDALIDALVVNETYFFREAEQLRALCDTVLAPMVARGEVPRVWCAACSTGEEPLTLAMMLADRGIGSKVEIVASDIGARVLERAKAGTFGPRSLRALPPGIVGRWLDVTDGRAVVSRPLVDRIDWRRVNLTDAAAVAALGSFDAIVCRNVLIYFSDDTVRHVVSLLSNALRGPAPLLVGASESLLRFGTLLKCEERAGAFFYVRADHG